MQPLPQTPLSPTAEAALEEEPEAPQTSEAEIGVSWPLLALTVVGGSALVAAGASLILRRRSGD